MQGGHSSAIIRKVPSFNVRVEYFIASVVDLSNWMAEVDSGLSAMGPCTNVVGSFTTVVDKG